MSHINDGGSYANVREGIDMFQLRYKQVVDETLPLLRYTDSVTIKTDEKELTACCIASGYSDGTRYYLGMDGIIYIFEQSFNRWTSAPSEYFAQNVRDHALKFNGKLNVPDFLSRIEDVLRQCETLARSLKTSDREVDMMARKAIQEFCI